MFDELLSIEYTLVCGSFAPVHVVLGSHINHGILAHYAALTMAMLTNSQGTFHGS